MLKTKGLTSQERRYCEERKSPKLFLVVVVADGTSNPPIPKDRITKRIARKTKSVAV